jgi:hypothetical protein
MNHPLLALSILLTGAASLRSQHDMIGVTFTGQVVGFNSHTGDGALIVQSAFAGMNAAARVGNRVYATDRAIPPGGTTFSYHFGILDPESGNYVRTIAGAGDFRGLAAHPTDPNLVFGIREGTPDQLVTIDTVLQTVTLVGSTGRPGIQALNLYQGQLLAWDTTLGLMRVNMNTGLATDVSPAGSATGSVQFLVEHTDGRLLGGQTNLFEIDATTGVTTLIAPIAGGAFEIRGAEERLRVYASFGSGCNTPSGTPSVLSAAGPITNNVALVFQSAGHQPQSLGILIVGFDTTSASGQPLPFLLDPLLGTTGCRLFVRPDVTESGFTDVAGTFVKLVQMPFSVPPMTAFFAQVAVFEPSPGGLSWSNGLMVRFGV